MNAHTQRPRERRLLSTRTFVIAFAIVEAILLAWFITTDVRARRTRAAAAAAAPPPPASSSTRSTVP